MRPRERLEQKQTSRIFLRNHDHRDIIFNDTYHNAIWLKRKQSGKDIDELVWLKYPSKYLYMRTLATRSGYNRYVKGWIDLERQWLVGYHEPTQTGTSICKLKDYVATSRIGSSNTWNLELTKDGCIHKRINFSDGRYGIHRFGQNELITMWFGSSRPTSSLNMALYEIQDAEKIEDIEVYRSSSIMPMSYSYFDWYYLCHTDNGCLVYMKNGSNGDVWQIERVDGGNLQIFLLYRDRPGETGKPNLIGNNSTRAMRSGSKIFCINSSSEKVSGASTYLKYAYVQYSQDDGATWEIIRILLTKNATSSTMPKIYMCHRDKDYIYVFYTENGTVYKTKVFYIDGNEAVEITPSQTLLSVPVKGNMGIGTMEQAPFEYTQIKLDSSAETTEYSFHVMDAFDDNIIDGWGAIELQDGEVQEQVSDNFIMLTQTYGTRRMYIYLDAELKPNIDNYAFISEQYESSNGAEKLMDGDYCYQGGTLESEVNI